METRFQFLFTVRWPLGEALLNEDLKPTLDIPAEHLDEIINAIKTEFSQRDEKNRPSCTEYVTYRQLQDLLTSLSEYLACEIVVVEPITDANINEGENQ